MTQWSEDRPPLPPDWEQRRQRVFERDGWLCQLGFPEVCTVRATECDHKGERDDHRLTELQAVCSECHKVKTQQQSREAIQSKAALARPPKRVHPALR